MSSSSSNFTVSTVGRNGPSKSKSRTKDKKQEPEVGDKKFYLENIAQCMLAVVIAFAVYGIVIWFVGENTVSQSDELIMGGTGKVEGSGCSANSFMIGDGVCDEITNTERCVYDGGDCCLEDKQTHICRKCTCHMDFDESKLNVELDDFEAAIYSSDDIGRFLIVKHVVDVASKMTCSALCFDAMKNGRVEIDSILYFQSSVSRNCSCASFESCLNASHWQTISDELHVTLLKDTEVVGLTKKFLPCKNCFIRDAEYKSTSISGTEQLQALTAEHCQKKCQEHDSSTHFSWASDKYEDRQYRRSCWLKNTNGQLESEPDFISGPIECQLTNTTTTFDRSNVTKTTTEMTTAVTAPTVSNVIATADTTTHIVVNTTEIGKLFVMGGLEPWSVATGGNLFHPEVIDLDNPDASCTATSLNNYPIKAHGMKGALVSQTELLVCGGGSASSIVDKCYHVGGDAAKAPTQMIEARKFAAAILLDHDILWVTGGHTPSGDPVKTTEYVGWNESVPGPDLPKKNDRHCLLRISSSSAIMVGGRYNVIKTRMYSFDNGTWTDLDNLNNGRSDHTCTLIHDRENGNLILVAAGGYNWSQQLTHSTTELMSLDSKNGLLAWINGPNLPEAIQRSAGVTSSDGYSFLMIGGGGYWGTDFYSNAIHKLECFSLTCQWALMEQELVVPRTYAFAALIPDSLVTCS